MLFKLINYSVLLLIFSCNGFSANISIEHLQQLIVVQDNDGQKLQTKLRILENLDNLKGFDLTLSLQENNISIGEVSIGYDKKNAEIFLRSIVNKTINSKGETRLKGIGTSLIKVVKAIAKFYQAKNIRLIAKSDFFTPPKYNDLIKFYMKNGFKPGTKKNEMIFRME